MRLETEHLILREWETRDRPPFADILGDPEVMRFYPRTRTPLEAGEWIDFARFGLTRDGFSFLAVERKFDGAFLGLTGISRYSYAAPGNSDVEIGWLLGKPYWGQGFAPEAARACLDYGFSILNLPEIVAFTYRGNRPSRRVMEKLGMSYDPADDFDNPNVPDGHFIKPHVLYRARNPYQILD